MGARFAKADTSFGFGWRPLARLHEFFAERIWGVPARDQRRPRAALYRASRIAYSVFRGFLDNRLTIRAAALTYYSVLSVVPFLALAFSVLKGFGAYSAFVEGTVRPYLWHTFAGNPALVGAFERILAFVSRTDLSRLGALGLLLLVYTSVSLIRSVEQALDEIWGVQTGRPLLRQVTDYIALLVTTPLLVMVATTLATAAQSWAIVRFLREKLDLGGAIDFALRFTSVVVVWIALFAIYAILPNERIRARSAAIGAAVGAALWQGALIGHVKFQVGVASYNALYSVLSAIPIFLVWTYVSWLTVLVGAQVAASHQNEQVARQRFHARHADQALKEDLAVIAAALVARDFIEGRPRRGHVALAQRLEVPPPVMEEILEALVRSGLLARTTGDGEPGYVPARDLDGIRLKDLRTALRRQPHADGIRADVERQAGPELQRVLREAQAAGERSPSNLTLRQLADMAAGRS